MVILHDNKNLSGTSFGSALYRCHNAQSALLAQLNGFLLARRAPDFNLELANPHDLQRIGAAGLAHRLAAR